VFLERSMHPVWLSNAYLVGDRPGGTGIFVDSGAPLPPLLDRARREGLRIVAILSTHRHPDHVEGHEELVEKTGAAVYALRSEASFIAGARPLEPEEERRWDGIHVRVVPLPGHTSGQAGYLVDGVGLFTGDCMFRGSLGGTVGPSTSGFADARRAVDRILALPDETPLHPGHTDPTTVGDERRENPFVRVMTGLDPEGRGRCVALGRPADLVVLARDYDGGTKAWVRFDDGGDAIVPGSRVDPIAGG
jgi:hydroxyacylglutathione hydrolase